jgi:hypothetical protein
VAPSVGREADRTDPDEFDLLSAWRSKQEREIEEARRHWRAAPVGDVRPASVTEPAPAADAASTVEEGRGELIPPAAPNPFLRSGWGQDGPAFPAALFVAAGVGVVLADRPRPAVYPRPPAGRRGKP